MQAPDGSSPGAQRALIAMAADLKLQPIVVARALEYAFDNILSFPNASQALFFGIVRQGYHADMQLLNVTLQRLRRNFGGILVAPSVQHVSLEPWLTHPPTQGYKRVPHVMTNSQFHNGTPVPSAAPRVLGYSDGSRYQTASALSILPHIGSWPVPQARVINPSGGSLGPPHGAENVGGRRLAEKYGAFR